MGLRSLASAHGGRRRALPAVGWGCNVRPKAWERKGDPGEPFNTLLSKRESNTGMRLKAAADLKRTHGTETRS